MTPEQREHFEYLLRRYSAVCDSEHASIAEQVATDIIIGCIDSLLAQARAEEREAIARMAEMWFLDSGLTLLDSFADAIRARKDSDE